jgi:hypothetical protein
MVENLGAVVRTARGIEGEEKVEGILETGMRAKVRGAVWVSRLTGRDMVCARAIEKDQEE